MIKVYFRKKTLLGSTVYRAGELSTPASVFTRESLREDLRGIVLAWGIVETCGKYWREG